MAQACRSKKQAILLHAKIKPASCMSSSQMVVVDYKGIGCSIKIRSYVAKEVCWRMCCCITLQSTHLPQGVLHHHHFDVYVKTECYERFLICELRILNIIYEMFPIWSIVFLDICTYEMVCTTTSTWSSSVKLFQQHFYSEDRGWLTATFFFLLGAFGLYRYNYRVSVTSVCATAHPRHPTLWFNV